MTSPRYRYSLRLFPRFVRLLLGVPSSLSADAAALLHGAQPPPRALNSQNIPSTGPFILVFNHYDYPGLGAWWGAGLLATTIAARRASAPREIHLAMAREWWYPHGFGKWLKQPFTRWFFSQLGKAYGLIRLPPVLGNNEFRGEGAWAIRHALALTRRDPPELIGLAPEGQTGAGLTLCHPPPGAGLFLLLLTHDKIPILPAGIYEDASQTLMVNFGAPFELRVPRALPREAQDRQAVRQVMVAIGRLLPERMWGVYRTEIREAL